MTGAGIVNYLYLYHVYRQVLKQLVWNSVCMHSCTMILLTHLPYILLLVTLSRAVKWSLVVLIITTSPDQSPGFPWPLRPTGRSKWTGANICLFTFLNVDSSKPLPSAYTHATHLFILLLLLLLTVLPSMDRLWPVMVAARLSLTPALLSLLAQPMTSTAWILLSEHPQINTEWWGK